MRSFPIICFFLISKVYSDGWNTKDYIKKENSLSKPYSDDKWKLLGGAMITNNYVRLTADQQSRKGAIWNSVPCRVVSWEMHTHMRIHGSGRSVFGDGMAVWYARDRMTLGPVFGSVNHFYGLGVFFDTYPNREEKHKHTFPYISVMVSNASSSFEHDNDGHNNIIAGCEADLRASKHDTFVAIRYEANTLTVSTDMEGRNAWKECLRVPQVHLPTSLFFGASAATGGVSDNHDIISMKLYDVGGSQEYHSSMDDIVPLVEHFQEKATEPAAASAEGGWSVAYTIFVVIVVIAIIIITILALYFYYEAQNNKKRFY